MSRMKNHFDICDSIEKSREVDIARVVCSYNSHAGLMISTPVSQSRFPWFDPLGRHTLYSTFLLCFFSRLSFFIFRFEYYILLEQVLKRNL